MATACTRPCSWQSQVSTAAAPAPAMCTAGAGPKPAHAMQRSGAAGASRAPVVERAAAQPNLGCALNLQHAAPVHARCNQGSGRDTVHGESESHDVFVRSDSTCVCGVRGEKLGPSQPAPQATASCSFDETMNHTPFMHSMDHLPGRPVRAHSPPAMYESTAALNSSMRRCWSSRVMLSC